MAIASVLSHKRGHVDALLNGAYSRLTRDGVRVIGTLRAIPIVAGGSCESDLWLLPNGPVARITQNLGAGSIACRMDACALEDAVGEVTARQRAGGAELLMLNKFGLSEAEGRGFRALIVEALGSGLPVLVGLSPSHVDAFESFSGGLAIHLPPREDEVLSWCWSVIAHPAYDDSSALREHDCGVSSRGR